MRKVTSLILSISLCFLPAVGAGAQITTPNQPNGYYFIDKSGLAVWWVYNNETPAQGLVRDLGVHDPQNRDANGLYTGPCLTNSIQYSLRLQFPNDPYVDEVPVCWVPIVFVPVAVQQTPVPTPVTGTKPLSPAVCVIAALCGS